MIPQPKNNDPFKTDFLGRPMTGPRGAPGGLLGLVCVIAIIAGIVYYIKGDSVKPPPYDTSSTKIIRKTIKDTTLHKDDIIRLPGFADSSRAIAQFLDAHKNMKFEFSVHMSPADTDSYIQSLKASQQLAEENVKLLVHDLCVDSLQLTPKGYGMLLPLSAQEEIESAKTPAEKEKIAKINRRCELKITSVK